MAHLLSSSNDRLRLQLQLSLPLSIHPLFLRVPAMLLLGLWMATYDIVPAYVHRNYSIPGTQVYFQCPKNEQGCKLHGGKDIWLFLLPDNSNSPSIRAQIGKEVHRDTYKSYYYIYTGFIIQDLPKIPVRAQMYGCMCTTIAFVSLSLISIGCWQQQYANTCNSWVQKYNLSWQCMALCAHVNEPLRWLWPQKVKI